MSECKEGCCPYAERKNEALAEVLACWAKQEILDEIEPDDPTISRMAPLSKIPRTRDVRRWRAALAASPAESSPTNYDSFGYALAMRVMQDPMYHQLDDRERAECDELIARGMRPGCDSGGLKHEDL